VFVVDFTARLHGILDLPAFCSLPVALRPGGVRWPKLLASAETLRLHLEKRMPGYELALHTHCVRLLDLLWKESLEQAAPDTSPGDPTAADGSRLLPAFREIEARIGGRVTLAALAAAVHLHPTYFCTLFKRVTGLSPLHYVAGYRLRRARDLLLLTDRPVGEIAALTGFYDAAHLVRAFHRAEGVSPGRYRKSNQRPISR
jgi:transcriptional regulator GlxA family with amidase domain